MADNWPIHPNDLRAALQYAPGEDESEELELYVLAACERIDDYTGRNVDPTRHERPDGKLPAIFLLAARATAALWWRQDKNGSRGRAQPEGGDGVPLAADLPRKVQGWLSPYPPRLYSGGDG